MKSVSLDLESDVEAGSRYIAAMGRPGEPNALPFTRLAGDDAEDITGLQGPAGRSSSRARYSATEETVVRRNGAAMYRGMRV